jgi:hypothetical protein
MAAVVAGIGPVYAAARSGVVAAGAGSTRVAGPRAGGRVGPRRTTSAALRDVAAGAGAAGDEKKATEAETAAEPRQTWLVEAEKTLAEFS